jgi:outer membrane protein OmpA-like peptidoglycan-associated protein
VDACSPRATLGRRRFVPCLLLLLAGVGLASAQYKPDDPIPPGAQAKVLPLQGRVVEIRGLSLAVASKTEALSAALKDLGAKTTEMEIRIQLSSDVLFDFDKADLLPKAIPTLEKVATVLKSYPNAGATVEGHTDAKGDEQYNQKLSERRAESVRKWLVDYGVSNAVTTAGFGKRKPVAPNTLPNGKDNPEGRQKNRRVEIVVKKG